MGPVADVSLPLCQAGLGEGEPDFLGRSAIRLHILPFDRAFVHAGARIGWKRQKFAGLPDGGRCGGCRFWVHRLRWNRSGRSLGRRESRGLLRRLQRSGDDGGVGRDESRGPGRRYRHCACVRTRFSRNSSCAATRAAQTTLNARPRIRLNAAARIARRSGRPQGRRLVRAFWREILSILRGGALPIDVPTA